MSEPIDDKAFDDYLSRQSQVSRQYRELEGSGVPPDLDRLVLDHAAQAVEKKPRSTAGMWRRWSVPVALAASTVLTLAVVIESGLEPDAVLAPKSVSTQEQSPVASATFEDDSSVELMRVESPPAPAMAPPASPAEQPTDRSEAAERSKAEPKADAQRRVPSNDKTIEQITTTAIRREDRVMDVPMSVTALDGREETEQSENAASPPAASSAAPTTAASTVASRRSVVPLPAQSQGGAAPEGATASSDDRALSARNDQLDEVIMTGQRRQEQTIVGPRGTLMRRAAPAEPAVDADAEEQSREADPARWLEFIRELRRDRKTEEADRQWLEFRKIYPEYAVAETDSARPER